MMPIYYILGVVSLVLLQTTVVQEIAIAGIKPDLPLVAIYFVGLYAGEIRGALTGLGLGYLMDLMSGGVWGVHLATKTGVGFLAGLLGRTMINVNAAFTGMIVALYSSVQGVVILVVSLFTSRSEDLSYSLLHTILPQALYDGAIGIFVFLILSRRYQPKEEPVGGWFTHELFFLSPGRNQRDQS